MTLKEILTTYWSQATLVIAGVAFFVNRYLTIISKKNETKYTLFQHGKINAIIKFYSSVSEVERMWHKLPIYQVSRREMTPNELDEFVWPSLNKLEKSLFELTLYLDEIELKEFYLIKDYFYELNRIVSEAFSNGQYQAGVNWPSEYYFAHVEAVKKVRKALEQIGKNTRNVFKSHS